MRWVHTILLTVFVAFGAASSAAANPMKQVMFASSVTASEKQIIRSAVYAAPQQLQQMLQRLPVRLQIESRRTKRKLSFAYLGGKTAKIKFDRYHLSHRMARHVIWHEIGHVLHYEGLNSVAENTLRREFRKSKSWKSCFPMNSKCVPFAEVLADQFAFWATGTRTSQSIYRIPPLVSFKRLGQLTRLHYKPASQ